MTIRVLLRDHPHRAVALATDDHILTFRHSPSTAGASSLSVNSTQSATLQPRCMVEFARTADTDITDFRSLTSLTVFGTLGLITINGDIFLCVVNGAQRAATVRNGENVLKITSVEFHCINKSDYDSLVLDRINNFSTDDIEEDGFDHYHARDSVMEHPCMAMKKLLSGGSFYYSADFDLTRRLQDRSSLSATVAIDSLDAGFLWNSYMIQPLVSFRSRLSEREKKELDASRMLTSAIRGFAMTLTVPPASSPISHASAGFPSTLTLLSRLSCRRAGTRFNARGIDDDGNVANFVETEVIFSTPSGMSFSYVQVRGSIPLFWEQAAGFTPGQQKIQLTRSAEASQPAFDKHMSDLEISYGNIHVVNLLSNEKPGELELSRRYQYHVRNSPLNLPSGEPGEKEVEDHELIKETDYDFHAETRALGYEAAKGIRRYLQDSIENFAYFLSEEVDEEPKNANGRPQSLMRRNMNILQQEGVFRTNCLDCLDRTNLIQTLISQMAIQEFLNQRGERQATNDFWVRHGTLWADNGDALSRIYAGTGALKSSFTRHGKSSLAGAFADFRKSATRLYINNFEDKGRQNTIDMLLGRLVDQVPVHLFDPINDWVSAELTKRTNEYSACDNINIYVGTFNLNGKTRGLSEDLSPWLCPPVDLSQQQPEIVAVGFQEIVDLSPQQIMSTDPHRRQAWEEAVKATLNEHAQTLGSEEYVMLRGGQLVGCSLSVFVKASILPYIKNVEGALKKTGMSGMAGNKGAVAIRMEYANTSICLVTAHLAAGFANYEERNQDYRTISHGLRFARNRSIEDHDTIIWLGDFNYRIGMANEKTRQLVKMGDLEKLYENDQLNLQMVHGKTFPYYNEARITFLPTYKYDVGTDEYDSSDKARIPAWCDRVLTKGNNLRQIHYNTAPLRFSDHRPVYATFQCTITVIDEKKKQEISEGLYRQRRAVVGGNTATARPDDTDDEDLIGYESIEPGLPPASSDKRKWWLDNGMPARSQVKPPAEGYVRNPQRAPNPFSATTEPDWVKVPRPNPPPPRSLSIRDRNSSTASQNSNGRVTPVSRKLPPVWPPHQQSSSAAPSSRASSTQHSLLDDPIEEPPLPPRPSDNRIGRKAAPPVPKKPTTLRSESPVSTRDDGFAPKLPQRVNTLQSQSPVTKSVSMPMLPPPRRSTVEVNTKGIESWSRQTSQSQNESGPPLPPRRGTAQRNLLDDEDEGGMSSWKPLRPN
ncbi:uncharacterized protein M437DRAFT_65721 [Aureobasidium melanogenum CBS 110374]|uniref:phosphoinositide 5-phosphatase n=1 Tax=Aureobasidium melanogenum (strain CBS 110374) TaxID=1043003 RepID=A0A074VZL5_AURM1|nr:uncharacterized protein M437DRAFT_65721 [Aureobasidium melanogenum CBS 110374]KEQ63117.1 hypothetical protein M437DRAFT_65721 [Aureobasidium melanogenum CBS 110374]